MEKPPAFQFYPKDFLSDANVSVMNMEEVGIYWWLICHLWIEGSLPKNQKALRELCKNPPNWKEDWKKVKKCFYANGTRLYHKRLEKERKKQEEWREKSRRGGLESVKTRRRKKDLRVVKPPFKRPVEGKGNSSSSSSSSSSKKEKRIKYGQDELDRLFEKFWSRYPKKVDKGEAKTKWLTNVVTYGVDPETLEMALTGYIVVLNKNETPAFYAKHAKTFLYQGSKKRGIPPTWQEYIQFADPKFRKPPL